MTTIRQAAQALAALDTDHATEQNGVGFAGSTQYVHDLLEFPRWTADQQARVAKALLLHKNQLESLGFPGPFDNEPTVVEEVAASGFIGHDSMSFVVSFQYSDRVRLALKERVQGCRWDGERKVWTVPTSSWAALESFGEAYAFSWTPDASQKLRVARTEQPPVAAPSPSRPTRFVLMQDGEFVIGFPYSPDAVVEVKEIPGRRFDPTRKVWTAPLISEMEVRAFAARHNLVLGPSMAKTTEVKQTMLKTSKAVDSTFMADFRSKSGLALYPYQRAGAEHLAKNKKTYLADGMRLGKTVQTMAAIHHITETEKRFLRVLVICPSSVVSVWERHVAEWLPKYKTVKAPNLPNGPGVYITSYHRAVNNREALGRVHWDLVVCDEAHKLKNRKAQRTKVIIGDRDVAGLVASAPYRWFLTGTAVEKKPAELLQPLIGLDRLRDMGGFAGFASRYCGWVQGVPGSIEGCVYERLPELNERLRATGSWLRRTMEDVYVELPERTYIHVPLEMDSKAAKTYYRAAQEAAGKEFKEPVEAIAELTMLRRLAALGKLDAAIEWLEEWMDDTDQKLVLLGWHTEPLQTIHEHFKGSSVILTGSSSADQRVKAMDRFQTDPNCRLFVGNILAAGEGINLSAASDVAIFELPWNASTLSQGVARILQPGKTTRMGIHYLLAKGTVDEDIAAMVDRKMKLSTAIHDGRMVADDDKELVMNVLKNLQAKSEPRLEEAVGKEEFF